VQEHGDARLGVHAHNLLGLVHADLGRLEASLAMHERAMECAAASGIPDLALVVVTNLAGRWLALGERADASGERAEALSAWGRALDAYASARALCEAHQLEHGSPHVLATHGATLFRLGREEEALAVFCRQREIAERTRDWTSLGYAARYLAQLHRGRGDLTAARAALADGIAAMEAIGARTRLVDLHEMASLMEESAGRFAEALAHHKAFHALHVACAVERAELRARLLAVRLDTERALAEARAARGRAAALQEAHTSLTRRAEEDRRAARTDALTGVANRRHLDEELARLFERARAIQEPLAVAIVDADHFKRVNDDFSHATGDTVLRCLAGILAETLGPNALCARYGGEEFAVGLPGADVAVAVTLLERLRAAVEGFSWGAVASGLRVTVSVGVVSANATHDAADALSRADEVLYRAKRTGRNRVCVAGNHRTIAPKAMD
jgi:diguanylate cyclase (GGDEF)-like protein